MNLKFGSVVLETASRLMVPFILLFAAYMVTHGHYGPGGGFQAGALLAISFILMRLVQGKDTVWRLNQRQAIALACLGVFIYAAIGIAAPFFGGNILDYGVLPFGGEAKEVRALGTLLIEVGVTIAVMGVFIAIFESLVREEE